MILLQYLWLKVLELSISASVIVLIILLLRRIGGKILTPPMMAWVWLILILKLIAPFHIPSSFSMENVTDTYLYQKDYSVGAVLNAVATGLTEIQQGLNKHLDNNSEIAKEINVYKSGVLTKEINRIDDPARVEQLKLLSTMDGILTVAAVVWLSGFIISFKIKIFRYWKFKRIFLKRNDCEDKEIIQLFNECKQKLGITKKIDLLISGSIFPMIHGVVKPQLLLPYDCKRHFTLEELRFILLHELQHYKQKDTLLFGIADILKAIHWFNPFIHLGIQKLKDDREVLCDYQVIRYLEKEQCLTYGMLLLKQAEFNNSQYPKTSMTANWFESKSQLTLRIKQIAKFNLLKPKKYHFFAGVGTVLLMSTIFLTGSNIYAEQKRLMETEPTLYAFWIDEELGTETITKMAEQIAGLSSEDMSVKLLLKDNQALESSATRYLLLIEQTWPLSILYSEQPIEIKTEYIRQEVQNRGLEAGRIYLMLHYNFATVKFSAMGVGKSTILDLPSLEKLDRVNLY